ncbi:MAG: helix-turn-helix domain-containing protein [Firmicutes bacterium]|nr:helix-turn-helix domain-containing protein [Bacillota bacterium]MBR5489225.1 helix-turn-helix domain-containing protein [Bacillota bacterium]
MKKNENITTPGAVVVKQMKLKKMTETELAAEMGVSKNHVQKLIAGEVRLTDATAGKLEKALDLPKEFWTNLEEVYRAKLEEE